MGSDNKIKTPTALYNELIPHISAATKIDIVCTGTPYIIGDAVGPMVGTMLTDSIAEFTLDVKIHGTLADPVVSSNYKRKIKELRGDALVIVIDAAVGNSEPHIEIVKGAFKPGSAINDRLQAIGDVGIKCYMGMNLKELMRCGVDLLYNMSKCVAAALMVVLTTSCAD